MFYVLRHLAHVILVLNFILFLYRFKKEDRAFKIYTIYLGIIVLIELLIQIIINLGYENLFLSHFYFTGQFILLSLFYLELLTENYQRKIIKFNLVVVPFILLINFIINPTQFFEFCMIEILLTSITIISYSTFHFYNMLSNKKKFYFINNGILIYLFGSTVTFLPRNLHTIYGYSFAMALQVLNIVLYLVYLIFIFLEWRQINLKSKK